ncbi:hypothetical protein HBI56_165360 [Parastagonospora nodorum]|uniref:Uncharacterized protein n=1 Tax=Phaeosphaeria nodorum (strain SN15 / ATCC MYA-4574 / FGSC 10173) TaxID=321614 RepID=A0A7U2IBC2_PHANO|nr:hypothetical protein HBH56_073110 [Parastagonospora nodorum]QRD06670.1 hypothetical protein JI435_135780 [Parastagonospora nodorum SN15]KAH3927462.1 hypothetical protein HBH54_153350 [Parastagonospora nodorum]KAH3951946.1 hypothetical protein HBH53_055020 [Parastagonospora nodorum]KAH3981558.1 hypothetical protein HBH51_040110 [Parastagonospora nodorum]
MAHFSDLPRELRDMIYMAVITWERQRPEIAQTSNPWNWYRTGSSSSGCHFALEPPPSTCANVLAVNRQVNLEMKQALERARRAGLVMARIDCIAKKIARREAGYYFTWLSIPIVQRSRAVMKSRCVVIAWPSVPVVGRLLASSTRKESISDSPTCIEQLQVDIRLHDQDLEDGAYSGSSTIVNISWAVCAALKRICDHSKETDSWPASLAIDTLVLNVLRPDAPKSRQDDSEKWKDSARAVTRELVNVWNKLWSGDEYRSRYYGGLLEKIKRVRVCVDGELVRERELRLELERGQAERRRIAQRVGW